MNAFLDKLHILITRPKNQAAKICAQLEADGAIVSQLPVLEIAPVSPTDNTRKILRQVDGYDTVIFISTNAVNYALQLGGTDFKTRLSQCKIGAIGSKTAEALTAMGLHVDSLPTQGFTSEDFLALPSMQPDVLTHSKILLVRGQGGRELLAKTLRLRGASVDYVEVYQRKCPASDTIFPVIQRQVQLPIDIIAITSSEGLQNLLVLLKETQWLKTTPLLVGSNRIAQDAISAGFTATLVVANDPGDCSMLEALLRWRQEKQHDR